MARTHRPGATPFPALGSQKVAHRVASGASARPDSLRQFDRTGLAPSAFELAPASPAARAGAPLAGLSPRPHSNDVWTVDFKGHFPAADGTRCEPLTVRDRFSRYGLCARVLPDRSEGRARGQFVVLLRRHGQPHTIHCDQGGPFGSAGPAHLSRLSAWWVSLGIVVEFSRRARPGDNAAHEQWHRELKAETARPPAATLPAQQRRTQRWLRQYNQERPHEALGQQTPAQHWRKSWRKYRGVRPTRYPRGWEVRRVQQRGEINWRGRVRFVSEALAGYAVGLRRRNQRVWHVYFYEIFIGELHDGEAGPLRAARYRRRVRTPKKVSLMS